MDYAPLFTAERQNRMLRISKVDLIPDPRYEGSLWQIHVVPRFNHEGARDEYGNLSSQIS